MKFKQAPHTLLMIRPSSFRFNPETASSNTFQKSGGHDQRNIQKQALEEFDQMIELLQSGGINIFVFQDTVSPEKPDAIFPNNWVSFQPNGEIVLYPLMAENRRYERRRDIVNVVTDHFNVHKIIDLSAEEETGRFLEGTGSIVFDHPNRIMYACHSPRTNVQLVDKLGIELGYRPIVFAAHGEDQVPVYHTNVVLSIGTEFAVLCLDAIKNEADQEIILENLTQTSHKVISISFSQMKSFAGNIIEVESVRGEYILLMSQTALDSLLPGQIEAISRFTTILPISIPTVETYGGGGVRCMIAGIHLAPKEIKLVS